MPAATETYEQSLAKIGRNAAERLKHLNHVRAVAIIPNGDGYILRAYTRTGDQQGFARTALLEVTRQAAIIGRLQSNVRTIGDDDFGSHRPVDPVYLHEFNR